MPARAALRRSLAGVQAVLTSTMRRAASEPRASGEGAGAGTRPLGLHLLDSVDAIRLPDEAAAPEPARLDAPLQVRSSRAAPVIAHRLVLELATTEDCRWAALGSALRS